MKRPLPDLTSIRRLLVVKTSSIGDIIHTLPVVQAFADASAGTAIDWVVRERCADILRGNPFIRTLHVIPDRPGAGDLLALSRKLRGIGYDCAMDMQGLALSGVLTWLSGAPFRLGWDRNREFNALFLTHTLVAGGEKDCHEIDMLYGFPHAFGLKAPHSGYIRQPYLAAQYCEELSMTLAPVPRPRIALNMGASRDYKRWPLDSWKVLARALLDRGYGLVFTGAQEDTSAGETVRSALQEGSRALNLCGRTGLRQLASALSLCDLAVSGDSGPMHLAVAVGTPVVALFGGTSPVRHGPYGMDDLVLHKPAPGEEPSRRPSRDFGLASMRAITVADVLGAIERAGAGAVATHRSEDYFQHG